MNVLFRAMTSMLFGLLALAAPLSAALSEEADDKTLSPYFFVKSDNPELDQLPLRSTRAAVNIVGAIADVTVTQEYKNEGRRPIEAVYVFPASTRAAVYAMQMTIGERTVTAQIKEREQARRDYEAARSAGQGASLLEQQRPNVFQMNVANIMPGDSIKVEMKYTELLTPEEGIYEFVYPTVVGPRYSNRPADAAPAQERWIKSPYLHQGESTAFPTDIQVRLAAGLPIQDLTSPSHKITVQFADANTASVTLDKAEQNAGAKDYILKYRLSGGQIESGLLLYRGEKENFFLAMIQPPQRVAAAAIPARDYIFIVDVSGSMHGFPLDTAKELLRNLIGGLRPSDTFNVLLFSGGSSVMAERSVPATPANIAEAVRLIDRQQGGGGTELLPALKRALSLPAADNIARSIVIATDGYVSVESEAFALIRESLGAANLFAFGIGSSVNRHLIEGMAHAGLGEPFIVTQPAEAAEQADKLRRYIATPVLTDIKVAYKDFDAYDVEPPSIPDVLAERPVLIHGKWRGEARGSIRITGISGSGSYSSLLNAGSVRPSSENSALRYLWARTRVAVLGDFGAVQAAAAENVREITALGLTYNLLTRYTSFVAIDSEVRNKDGRQTTVDQPLPLPEGVSEHAIGGWSLNSVAKSLAAPQMLERSRGLALKQGPEQDAEREVEKQQIAKESKPPVSREELSVQGGLTAAAVAAAVKAQAAKLSLCSAKHGRAAIKAVLRFVIDALGRATDIQAASTSGSAELDQCLIDAVRGLQFPAPASGAPTRVSYPFLFDASGSLIAQGEGR